MKKRKGTKKFMKGKFSYEESKKNNKLVDDKGECNYQEEKQTFI